MLVSKSNLVLSKTAKFPSLSILNVFSPVPPVIEKIKSSPSASDAITDPTPLPLEEFSSILNVWSSITGGLLLGSSFISLILTVIVASSLAFPSLTSTLIFNEVFFS